PTMVSAGAYPCFDGRRARSQPWLLLEGAARPLGNRVVLASELALDWCRLAERVTNLRRRLVRASAETASLRSERARLATLRVVRLQPGGLDCVSPHVLQPLLSRQAIARRYRTERDARRTARSATGRRDVRASQLE